MKMIARILPLLLVALPVAAQSTPSSLTDSFRMALSPDLSSGSCMS